MLNEPLIQMKKINKSFYGIQVLKDIDLDVYKGEIHAICGENGAGKSTLMNILTGSLMPDSGEIIYDGKEVKLFSPKDAQNLGISIVHQELSLFPHLSVAENIYAGRLPIKKNNIIDRQKMNSMASEILNKLNANIDVEAAVSGLSISKQQMVEIAKAISMNCNVLILDEPTSALTEAEADDLFKVLKRLKETGIAILYISHKLNEIFSNCQRCTVMRDGVRIWTKEISETSVDETVSSMVGRKIDNIYPAKGKKGNKVLLKVKGLTRHGVYSNISFDLYDGEILGIAGLIGAGRSEIARGICGIDHVDSGEVQLLGEKIPLNNVRKSIDKGLIYITEDRKSQGLFLQMSIKENIVAPDLKQISSNGFIKEKLVTKISEEFKERLNIKCRDVNQKILNLSGGNQQKVLLSKWLYVNPKVLILDEPTRGIDVGAKHEIHEILRKLSNEGRGVIVISSELPEILGISDRIIVIHEGEITGEILANEASEELIMQYATGRKNNYKKNEVKEA